MPPLMTDIELSVDDRFLYVSCWGTGEMRQYDVSDPVQSEADRLGPHRRHCQAGRASEGSGAPITGGPQMVEVSRDGRRVYFTNSLYAAWDKQFYPEDVGNWMVKLEADPQGGIQFDPQFFFETGNTGCIRFGWKAATPHPIPIALPRRLLTATRPFQYFNSLLTIISSNQP